MSQSKRVRLSTAALRVRGVAGIAVVLAVWHGLGIPETPERSFFWFMTAADVLVAAVAIRLGRRWPRYADVEEGGIVLLRQRIRYEAVTGIRLGDVSAKPFWLAFWLPTSLLVGLIVAFVPSSSFTREVLEINTANGCARLRWRGAGGHDQVVRALRDARPDLVPKYGLDGHSPARDFSPRMGIGGGLLAACLALWAFLGGWSGLQLLDRSTIDEPASLAATTSALDSVTRKLSGYDPLPGVRPEFTTELCPRVNDFLLGSSPDVVDLHLEIVAPEVPEEVADVVEEHLRRNAGMKPSEYLHYVDRPRTEVAVDIPVVSTLYVEVFTGCVSLADVPALQAELEELARGVGVGR